MVVALDGLKTVREISDRFFHESGAATHPFPLLPKLPADLRQMADVYHSAPAATEVEFRASYDALTAALIDQWNALIYRGFVMYPWHGEGEPYRTSSDMRADLDQEYLWYLPTDTAGDLPQGHPMLDYVLVNTPYGDQTVMLLNDVFRAVHDCLAHGAGHSFGPVGEEGAWLEHRATLPRAAHLALWNETRGQNLWTNYGPHMWTATGRYKAEIPLRDRPFAPQRIVMPPESWL